MDAPSLRSLIIPGDAYTPPAKIVPGDPQVPHRTPEHPAVHPRWEGPDLQCSAAGREQQLPLGHHNVVNAVVDAHSRFPLIVRSELDVVNDLAIDKVADDQSARQVKLIMPETSFLIQTMQHFACSTALTNL